METAENATDPDVQVIKSQTFTGAFDIAIHTKGKLAQLKVFLAQLMSNQKYQWTVVILCSMDGLLEILMLMLEVEQLKLEYGASRSRLQLVKDIMEILNYVIGIVFVVELVIKLWVFGLKLYYRHFAEALDAVLTIINTSLDTWELLDNNEEHHDVSSTTEKGKRPGYQKTVTDAAGFLILLRLWRLVCIISAFMQATTTRLERAMDKLEIDSNLSKLRLRQLEEIFVRHQLAMPGKEEEEFLSSRR